MQRVEPPAPIRWRCSVCDDRGVISSWPDSLFDLRGRQLAGAEPGIGIVISSAGAAALRDLQLLDPACEDLDELVDNIAAEAHRERSRRRQRRLDAAFDALDDAMHR